MPKTLSPALISRERIEEMTLELLNITISDREVYGYHIPDGYARYDVSRNDRPIGTISTWGDKYHTRMGTELGGFSSIYAAATCWIDPWRLELAEAFADGVLQQRRIDMPDYF